MGKNYNVSEFVEMVGKSINTLQRLDRIYGLRKYKSKIKKVLNKND